MGFFSFLNWFGRSTAGPDDDYWDERDTSSAAISAREAFQVTAVLCAARVIAEGVSQSPLKLYEEENTGAHVVRKPARDHPLYDMVAYSPCWLTSQELAEVMLMHAVIEGHGICLLNRGGDPKGPILEMLPTAPGAIQVRWNHEFNEPEYWDVFEGEFVNPRDIFHLRGPTWDGNLSINVRQQARQAIGLSLLMEKTNGDLFSKGGRPSGVLSTDISLSEEQIAKHKKSFKKAYGPRGEGGIALLDSGFKFTPINMKATDAQLIENRKFQIEEVSRATRVFPQMIMQSDKTSTFGSATAFFRAHVTHTLMPWVSRYEGALKRDVIGYEDKNIWPRISVEALMRGDHKERAEYYQIMIQNGVMSRNEVRALENLNPREGGDEYLTPMNMRLGAGDEEPDDANKTAPVDLETIRYSRHGS